MTRHAIAAMICPVILVTLILIAGCAGAFGSKAVDKLAGHAAEGNASAGLSVPSAGNAEPGSGIPVTPLLGRPTDHSVNVNLLAAEGGRAFIEYHNATSAALQTTVTSMAAQVPQNIVLTGLAPDTAYTYRVCWQTTAAATDSCSGTYSFHTQRDTGSSFVFAVQADSHLDDRASGALYNQTLAEERAGSPDFLIDLGDTFMTEKLPVKDAESIRARYLLQRSYIGTVGSSAPVFLVLGNHDGETGYAVAGKDSSLARLSLQFRKMYFPNPEPDEFYTGNRDSQSGAGLMQDYYAWQWGDALFVVLDPYWYTTSKPGGKTDGWGWTLGKTQYDWLKETLAKNRAPYTFVFAHQLVGGDSQGRGGTEFASLYEWGGRNSDGSYGFDRQRPGWGVPIHQLLVENNVTAFFHGHDHFFAQQELDGITYQEVPQPATAGSAKGSPGTEYGYVSGVRLPSPGYLRITVAPDSARVEYIGSSGAGTAGSTVKTGEVVYSYSLPPRSGTTGK